MGAGVGRLSGRVRVSRQGPQSAHSVRDRYARLLCGHYHLGPDNFTADQWRGIDPVFLCVPVPVSRRRCRFPEWVDMWRSLADSQEALEPRQKPILIGNLRSAQARFVNAE